jgi:hypothetical protein
MLVTDFFFNDIGMACLVFWVVLGFLLFWFWYKISPLPDDNNDPQEPSNEEAIAKNSLLEQFRESETHDHQSQDDPHNPEQSTNA